MFNSTPKAERQRMFAEEAEQARIRREQEQADKERAPIDRRRAQVEKHGYDMNAGRVNDLGGYGVTLNPDDGTFTVGDAELEEPVTLPLAGAHARLETLASARDRVTAGRVAALGLYALAVPKRDRRRVLVIETPGAGEAVAVVDGSSEEHLRKWVAWFNRRAAAA